MTVLISERLMVAALLSYYFKIFRKKSCFVHVQYIMDPKIIYNSAFCSGMLISQIRGSGQDY